MMKYDLPLTEQEFHGREHQVLWSGRFVLDLIDRIEDLDQQTRDLYEKIFKSTLTKIPVPAFPLAREEKLDGYGGMINNSDPDIPLSIVVTTRNDTHTERMKERTQAFIDCIYEVAGKANRNAELVIVEWNPPADQPSLSDAYDFPECHPNVSTVIYTVGEDVHSQYVMADNTPLYQMIAKNVGIRRARGKFIVSTNIDVLFSQKLFEAMTDVSLSCGTIYRSHRTDVNKDILDLDNIADMLASVEEKTLRIHYPEGPLRPGEERRTFPGGGGDFYDRLAFKHDQRDNNGASGKVVLINLPSSMIGWDALPSLHYQQCGDFQLMHRNDWVRVRGYMELDGFIFHLDSLLAISCRAAGIREHIFDDDCLHYHIDHTTGVEVEPGLYRTNSGKLVPHLSIFDLIALSAYMANEQDYCQFNKVGWGGAAYTPKQRLVTAAVWDENKVVSSKATDLTQYSIKNCYVDDLQAFANHSMDWTIEKLRINFDTLVQHIKQHRAGRSIWIWGAGRRGEHLLQYLRRNMVDVQGFVSSDSGSTEMCGLPVHGSSELSFSAGDYVLVSSLFAASIYEQLIHLGAQEGADFLITP